MKATSHYNAEHDKGLLWDDPAIGIIWPHLADAEMLSGKDRVQPLLADLLPQFSVKD
ncbi:MULTISPECIES: dTDP-4-dehydrorhamnose 3,5-epimerase family protein [unclassified Novosphingobium]|uniref:dTDP-4-dehydrorhamnose 3,5-epimerase family protein n=1 Tax=unclassified Novosphingobium TaxID=2644732 RepID=UPI001ACB0C1C|nr:dTDP-4-dehydrorhamnose 3,5-epimerase family protein [Novosphingobium sp. 1748]MBN9145372.1 dTDP-4-dehydrorhamnose 3,5-epimerase family protein [Novosphingobium sp.]